MSPQPWILAVDDVLALPIDDLAMRVLSDANDNGEWNWHNWLLKAKNHAYPTRPDALTALSEAWAWLINRGLVVWDPRQSSEAAIVVSRQGSEALARGLPWLRAVQRLDLQLVAVLEAKARPQFLRGDFEAAAFMAMKEVEVRVRTMADLSNSTVGTKLMQAAFNPPSRSKQGGDLDLATAGPLWQEGSDGGEAVATMELFKGAIASSRTQRATVASTTPTRRRPPKWSSLPTSYCAC